MTLIEEWRGREGGSPDQEYMVWSHMHHVTHTPTYTHTHNTHTYPHTYTHPHTRHTHIHTRHTHTHTTHPHTHTYPHTQHLHPHTYPRTHNTPTPTQLTKAHVKHTICFIKHKEGDPLEIDGLKFDQVYQTTLCGQEDGKETLVSCRQIYGCLQSKPSLLTYQVTIISGVHHYSHIR